MPVTLEEVGAFMIPTTLTEVASGKDTSDITRYLRKSYPILTGLVCIIERLSELGVSPLNFCQSTILPPKAEEEFHRLEEWIKNREA